MALLKNLNPYFVKRKAYIIVAAVSVIGFFFGYFTTDVPVASVGGSTQAHILPDNAPAGARTVAAIAPTVAAGTDLKGGSAARPVTSTTPTRGGAALGSSDEIVDDEVQDNAAEEEEDEDVEGVEEEPDSAEGDDTEGESEDSAESDVDEDATDEADAVKKKQLSQGQ